MKHAGAIIKSIQITEKGTAQHEQGKYFFKVDPAANKLEIKKAVEELYKVPVARVNTMRYRGKLKRERTVQYGRRPEWKRAVVTLKEGNKIEMA
jgi:large subunit ribosomal protein L23